MALFDPELAAAEFARVLRPGGVIGLLWNIRDDRQSWVRSISDIVGGEDCVRAARGQERVGQALASEVGPVERAEFPNDLSLTPEALVGLVATLSYVRLRTDGDRILDAVRDLTATHPDLAGRDTFDLPHLTETYRARKG